MATYTPQQVKVNTSPSVASQGYVPGGAPSYIKPVSQSAPAPSAPAASTSLNTGAINPGSPITPSTIAAMTGTSNIYNQTMGNTLPTVTPKTNTTATDTGTPPINPGTDTGSGSGSGSGSGGYRSGGSSGGYSGGGASYAAPTLPTATDQSEYIRSMYDANERAARENLRAEYENNIAALDRAQGRLPDTYNTAVDQANTQAAINRANFNEAAAANGLNTGAGSQVRLSQNNALQGNVASIRKAQADAQSDLDFQRTQLEAQYQQAIRRAIADNDMQRAQALYQEARRVDESIVNTAVNQANLNWNVWRALYG